MIVAAGRLRGGLATDAAGFSTGRICGPSLRRLRGNGAVVLAGMVPGLAESEAAQGLQRFTGMALCASVEEFARRRVVSAIERRAFSGVLSDDYL